MRTIWKFELALTPRQTIRLPWTGIIRHVGVQRGQICLWAEIESDRPAEDRTIWLSGTGHELPDRILNYLGTVLLGDLVWHLYEDR